MTGCWLAQFSDKPCDGLWVMCHLIPKQLLKREFGKTEGRKLALHHGTWVWGCGGPMGNAGHHGQLDASRTLRIPREALPEATEIFAAEHDLLWYLEREYGPLEMAA